VTAKPGLTGNPAAIYGNYSYVYFETSPITPTIFSPWNPKMVTNSQGVTPSRTVPWNTKIRAWIYKVHPNHQKAYSNVFTCGNGPGPVPK
jgi:hypothetical protein